LRNMVMTIQDNLYPNPYELLANALECSPDKLNLDSTLGNPPNWDSIGHLNIMLALEEAYNISIDDDTIRRYTAMDAIVARYEELQKGC
jgi:acyl carrier protein